MIIQCENCSRKYVVRDQDLPAQGRTVKCSYCSSTWHQMPLTAKTSIVAPNPGITSTKKIKKNLSENFSSESIKASDGKTYKFIGTQWAELYPSGKTGLFAKKKINKELNNLTGRKTLKVVKKKVKKNKDVDPSSIISENSEQLPDIYKPKRELGFFGYIFLIIIIISIIIVALKIFEADLINYFPQMIQVYEILDKQITYVFETINNITTIFNDLIKSY